MSDIKDSSATGATNVVQFIPTQIGDLTVESRNVPLVRYPFQGTMILKTWHVGKSGVAKKVHKSLLEALKDDFVGKGNVWITDISFTMTSTKGSGRVCIAVVNEEAEVSDWRDAHGLTNREYIEFSGATKGTDFSRTLSWPTSVGRQLKPYDPHYAAPHLLLFADGDVDIACTLRFTINHTSNIIRSTGF